ncbi:MAG: aminopeptidase [Chloroflexota bacterium]
MADQRIEKLAHLLVNYSVSVQPGDTVAIRGNSAGLPLILAVHKEVIRAGGHPVPIWREPEFEEYLLREGNMDQIDFVEPTTTYPYTEADAFISIGSDTNTRHKSSVGSEAQSLRTAAKREMGETYMRRSASGELRWVGTLFPTAAYAQDADMSLEEFEDFVYGACHADKDDPVLEWHALSDMQQKLVDFLKGKKEVVVKGPNADLGLSIEGRLFINSDGKKNMPSGEIFTGPVENSVNGWVKYTFPAIHNGREVDGIELKFEDGRVVDATATKNQDYLLSVLDTDHGARYLGEFAIGTNYGIQRFTRSILYDEKIGGTMHMAVGASYPETGGVNKSAVHWDMICDMRSGGQIFVDGELFYDSGKFLIL